MSTVDTTKRNGPASDESGTAERGVALPLEGIMDLRDNLHDQIEQHIATLHVLSQLETPAQLVWTEVARYLLESASYLQTFVLPKIESKTPHVDLRGTGLAPRLATYVGATSEPEPADNGAVPQDEPAVPGFLGRK